jgi:hypothetical protein
MKNIKQKVVLSALVATIAGAAVFGTQTALAQDSENPHAMLVQKIAQKFGLQESEVQAVFDEEHAAMKVRMHARYEERLNQLVSEGKITEAQKQLIMQKHEELKANHETEFEALKDKTPEERRAFMEQKKQELDTWAQENGIDPEYLMFHIKIKGPRPI